MLYLVRKLNQSIMINNEISIQVIEINKGSVKLGFTFPKGYTVLRKEVFDSIAQQNMEALNTLEEYEIEKN